MQKKEKKKHMVGLTDVEIKKRVNDLLYIEKEIVNRLHSDIEEVLRGFQQFKIIYKKLSFEQKNYVCESYKPK